MSWPFHFLRVQMLDDPPAFVFWTVQYRHPQVFENSNS
jgi:hypothetical protein